MKRTILTILAIASLALVGCTDNRHHASHHRHVPKHTKSEHVYRLDNGRYVFQDNDIWYYYMFMSSMNDSSRTISYATPTQKLSFYTSSGSGFSRPSGGVWVAAKDIKEQNFDKEEEQLEMDLKDAVKDAPVEEQAIETTDSGVVANTEEQMEMSLSDDNVSESSTESSTSASESSSESSSDSDSGSSDSGSSSSDSGSSSSSD